MIIISNKPGQLGNRLILASQFICFGNEYNIKVFNPALDEYKKYFRNTDSRITDRAVYYLCYYIARALDRLRINNRFVSCKHINWDEEVELRKSDKTDYLFSYFCFIQGWKFRNNDLTVKHRSAVLKKFEPAERYLKLIDDFCKGNFTPNKLIIGIHIRRGDYRTFENGKYYFSFEEYHKIMKQTLNCFPENEVRFFITSNDKEAQNFFSSIELDCVFAPGHELVDMYCLSRCSYIIGPPSTFSMWASFYGEVPLHMIQSKDLIVKRDNFKIVTCFND